MSVKIRFRVVNSYSVRTLSNKGRNYSFSPLLALCLEFAFHLMHLDIATGMQASFPALEPMELLETPYKSHLLYRDLRPPGGSFHFMIILKILVKKTCSNTQGFSSLCLCQMNGGG